MKIAVFVLVALQSIDAPCAVPAARIEQRACAGLQSQVDETASSGAVFLRSFDEMDPAQPLSPSLRTAAFTYDESLSVIALLACHDSVRAGRVAEALRDAAIHDQRLRNTYRVGVVKDSPLPNGWWDANASRWVEDRAQMGTSTGNIAWAGLAMLAMFEVDHDKKWRDVATKLGRWIVENASDSKPGFAGGIDGFDDAPVRVAWKSTEHNIDAAAFFRRLSDDGVPGDWRTAEMSARAFVGAQWDSVSGHFLIGTLPDGVTPNRDASGLDAQVWPLLLRDAPKDWRRSLTYIEKEHAVPGGFDFNADRDGAWIEGTAQVALVYRVVERGADAQPLFATIASQVSAGGLVFATREARISTGLSTVPGGGHDDFYYFHVPHLGATAWAILAATGRNPFLAK